MKYWLELLFYSEYIEKKSYKSIDVDGKEPIKLLASIIKISKHN